MTDPPRRKRFQIHFSTAIVMTFVAGALLCVNLSKGTLTTNFHGEYAKYQTFGWPNPAPFYIIQHYGLESPKVVPFYFAYEMFPNVIVALATLFAAWLICEWLVRRRAARK
jgi:hypothetical protein